MGFWVVEAFGAHLVVQLRAMMDGVADVNRSSIRRLVDWAGDEFDFSDTSSRSASAKILLDIAAYKSTRHLTASLSKFANEQARSVPMLLPHRASKVAFYVAGILGENWMRVFGAVWGSST